MKEKSDNLTSREVQVLAHLCLGLEASEIATALGIARKTVYFHCNSLHKKLDAGGSSKSRIALVHGAGWWGVSIHDLRESARTGKTPPGRWAFGPIYADHADCEAVPAEDIRGDRPEDFA